MGKVENSGSGNDECGYIVITGKNLPLIIVDTIDGTVWSDCANVKVLRDAKKIAQILTEKTLPSA